GARVCTTKPAAKGTGLGLNISHNIVVHEHHGRIKVDSQPGRTTFRVLLPVTATGAEPAVGAQSGSSGRTSPRPSPLPPGRRPRLTEPWRMSPAANTPGALASRR